MLSHESSQFLFLFPSMHHSTFQQNNAHGHGILTKTLMKLCSRQHHYLQRPNYVHLNLYSVLFIAMWQESHLITLLNRIERNQDSNSNTPMYTYPILVNSFPCTFRKLSTNRRFNCKYKVLISFNTIIKIFFLKSNSFHW